MDFTLTIVETNDLHNQNSNNTQLITITGDAKEIIEPFSTVLKHFSSQTYEESQWPYSLDKNQVQILLQTCFVKYQRNTSKTK